MTVKSAAGVLSAQLEIRRANFPVSRAHCDALKNVNGKLQGAIVTDTDIPAPWAGLTELVLDAPFNDTMRIELHTTRPFTYTFRRQAGGVVVDEPPPPKMPVTPKSDPIPVVRVKAPPAEKIAEVTTVVRENFKAEYAKKSPVDRVELAEKLMKLAAESKGDSAGSYVLLCEARDVAASAGKWSIAADAFEQLEAGFDVDLLPQKEAALQLVVSSVLNRESATEVTEAALQGVGDAIAADHLALAGSFVAIAGKASAKALSVPHISLVKKAEAELKLVNQESDAATKARETLKTMPDDPAANLAVGRYEALRRGEWQPALPLLAKGSDADLAAVAKKDLESPKDGAAQQKVADEWWALAEKEKESTWIRAALQGRAAHWYRMAAPQATGLSLTLVHERLKTIEDAPSPFRIGGTTAELKILREHTKAVTSLHLTLDGKRLYSGQLRWDHEVVGPEAGQADHDLYGGAADLRSRLFAERQPARLGFKDSVKAVDTANAANTRLPSGIGNALPGAFWVDETRLAWVGPNTYSSASSTFGGSAAPHNMRISATVASPSHTKVITLGEETWLCDAFPINGMLAQRIKTQLIESTSAAFSPSQSVVAVATADKKISFCDLQSRAVTSSLEGGGSPARCMAYVPSGDRLLSGGDDGIVHLWDISSGKEVRHFSTGAKGVTSILVMPDGKQIITGGSDGVIRIWAMPRDRPTTKAAAGPASPDPETIVVAKSLTSNDPPPPAPLSQTAGKRRSFKDYLRIRESWDWPETRNALAEAIEDEPQPRPVDLLQLGMLEELNGRSAAREALARRILDGEGAASSWEDCTYAGRTYAVSACRNADAQFLAKVKGRVRDKATMKVSLFLGSLIEYRLKHFQAAVELGSRSLTQGTSDYPEGNIRLAIALAAFRQGQVAAARVQLQAAKRWQLEYGAADLGDGTGFERLLLLREAESLMPGIPAAPHSGGRLSYEAFDRLVRSKDWRECQSALEQSRLVDPENWTSRLSCNKAVEEERWRGNGSRTRRRLRPRWRWRR